MKMVALLDRQIRGQRGQIFFFSLALRQIAPQYDAHEHQDRTREACDQRSREVCTEAKRHYEV